MNKLFAAILLAVAPLFLSAQTQPVAGVMPFGKVDIADLEMKVCDFEKDANAEVLFNEGKFYFQHSGLGINMDVHKRVKIFNNKGTNEANIRIDFWGGNRLEYITNLKAQTINLINGKIEITPLDKKLIYYIKIDRLRSQMVFAMPNVKPGCIIEYQYTWNSNELIKIPAWLFQDRIPVRYSGLTVKTIADLEFMAQERVYQPYFKHTTVVKGNDTEQERVLINVPSFNDEPFMSSFIDNVQHVVFQLKSALYSIIDVSGTWQKAGSNILKDRDFIWQLDKSLKNEKSIINAAKALPTENEKIAYIFNVVKNTLKWNGVDNWYTMEGVVNAWENKTGNATEINLILYHLLKESGIKVYPMVVSTRDHGKVTAFYTSAGQFNRTIVYVRGDDTQSYFLDASGKYNVYNLPPFDLLNSSGLMIDRDNDQHAIVYIHNEVPARQGIFISAEIAPNGKMKGTAQISNFGYQRTDALEHYNKSGEKQYLDDLRGNDNNVQISNTQFENMNTDTLPLIQKINFSADLTGSDENYIYLIPNLFTPFKYNPFLNRYRYTDIDFGYLKTYSINGSYTIPAGYSVDALPKNLFFVTPDNSISFRRTVAEQGGSIAVRYTLEYLKQIYNKEDYPDFQEYMKVLYQMLNEPIILKKS